MLVNWGAGFESFTFYPQDEEKLLTCWGDRLTWGTTWSTCWMDRTSLPRHRGGGTRCWSTPGSPRTPDEGRPGEGEGSPYTRRAPPLPGWDWRSGHGDRSWTVRQQWTVLHWPGSGTERTRTGEGGSAAVNSSQLRWICSVSRNWLSNLHFRFK